MIKNTKQEYRSNVNIIENAKAPCLEWRIRNSWSTVKTIPFLSNKVFEQKA